MMLPAGQLASDLPDDKGDHILVNDLFDIVGVIGGLDRLRDSSKQAEGASTPP
jgi:hypothetical protein